MSDEELRGLVREAVAAYAAAMDTMDPDGWVGPGEWARWTRAMEALSEHLEARR